MSGLIIGSVVPDFGYFVREFVVASFAHTVVGTFCISLPTGLAVYLCMRLCFRRIADMMPHPHAGFLLSWGIERPIDRRNLLGIVIAIVVGALSHNFVDSFTHVSGAAVVMFPSLSKEVFSIGHEPLHLFRILQYSGSVLGMAMIFSAYWVGLNQHCRRRACRLWQDSRRWMLLIGLILVTVLCATAWNAEWLPREVDFYAFRVFGFKLLITWLPMIGAAFLCCAMLLSPKANSGQIGDEASDR
jgi:hypothetical protein